MYICTERKPNLQKQLHSPKKNDKIMTKRRQRNDELYIVQEIQE